MVPETEQKDNIYHRSITFFTAINNSKKIALHPENKRWKEIRAFFILTSCIITIRALFFTTVYIYKSFTNVNLNISF